jgi:hypothetical protein
LYLNGLPASPFMNDEALWRGNAAAASAERDYRSILRVEQWDYVSYLT